MKLQDHNVIKGLVDALIGPRADESGVEAVLEQRDGMPVATIGGVKCAVDVANRVVQTGEGKEQRWFEIAVRDVTPKRFLSPEEQAELGREHEDWWTVTSSARMVFVRNRSRSGAIEDFLRRFPGEASSGMDAPEAELARGIEFVDDEGDRIRAEFIAKEVMEAEAEPPEAPQYPPPAQPGCGSGCGGCPAGQCSCGGCYPDPTESGEPEPEKPADRQPEEFYFGMGASPDGPYAAIVPKEFWDRNRCMQDEHFSVQGMPRYLGEPDMEAIWSVPDGKMSEDVAIDMAVAGFERSEDFESFLANAEAKGK